MGLLLNSTRKIVFWTYPRTSWQWDVLCVLILVFIFLSPKSWFETSEFRRIHMGATTVVVSSDLIGVQADKDAIERRAKALAARPDGHVTGLRERRDEKTGRLIGYEVDIR